MTEIVDVSIETGKLTAELITEIVDFQNVLSGYEEEMISTIQDMQEIVSSLNTLIGSSTELTKQTHKTIGKAKDNLYNGADASFEGAVKTFNETLEMLSKTNNIKHSKDTIKQVIEDEWHQIDEDYNILDIDVDAVPVSFVSSLNPAPNSVQIVLRTPEITQADEKESLDLEPPVQHITAWARIKNIFLSILNIFA